MCLSCRISCHILRSLRGTLTDGIVEVWVFFKEREVKEKEKKIEKERTRGVKKYKETKRERQWLGWGVRDSHKSGVPMVLISDGHSEIGAHLWS